MWYCLPRVQMPSIISKIAGKNRFHTWRYLCFWHTVSIGMLLRSINLCRVRIEAVLLKSNILTTIQRSIAEGGLRVEDLPIDRRLRQKPPSTNNQGQDSTEVSVGTGGPFGLWHFMYRSIYLDQYVSSEFSPPVTSHRQQKR